MEPCLGEEKHYLTALLLGNLSKGPSLILGGQLAIGTHPQQD